jgi:diadenosine tetraphosphate (Ap4A) HIT family hydrolase
MPSTPSCPICHGHWPLADHRIADCGLTIAYLHEDQFFPGWTVLVFKRHATELTQLTAKERSELIEEVTTVAQAVAAVFQPVKLNYALLGNQLPHIHWHVVPRLREDPAPLEAIWSVKHEPKRLSPEAREQRLAQLREQLGRNA